MQFIASMLGSMGVQGAVQVMHANIPMEFPGATQKLLTTISSGTPLYLSERHLCSLIGI